MGKHDPRNAQEAYGHQIADTAKQLLAASHLSDRETYDNILDILESQILQVRKLPWPRKESEST